MFLQILGKPKKKELASIFNKVMKTLPNQEAEISIATLTTTSGGNNVAGRQGHCPKTTTNK